jgi:hypothetical protein
LQSNPILWKTCIADSYFCYLHLSLAQLSKMLIHRFLESRPQPTRDSHLPCFFPGVQPQASQPLQAQDSETSFLIVAPAGIRIQPTGLAVGSLGPFSPTGINIQPIGVAVGSAAVVNSPTGVNIQPIGVAVGASGFQNAPTGVNVQPVGHRVGSANSIDAAFDSISGSNQTSTVEP